MIHITTALACEARPLIDYYKLTAVTGNNTYRIYTGDDLRLIITGIGKASAAAAVGYLHAYYGSEKNNAWLNIGIAGHPSLTISEGSLVHKITDQSSGIHWYPPPVIDLESPTHDLISVDRPETEFSNPAFYDMEASGFYAAAIKFATSELVQCYKVVSDNQINHADAISKRFATKLIEDNLKILGSIIVQSNRLASEISIIEAQPRGFDDCIRRWHFTHYQRNQLYQLLRRWETLSLNKDNLPDLLRNFSNGKQVISFLQHGIKNYPINNNIGQA